MEKYTIHVEFLIEFTLCHKVLLTKDILLTLGWEKFHNWPKETERFTVIYCPQI